LFPTQIRDELVAKGTKGSSPKNLLISIHNVLSRNEKSLDVKEVDGRYAYKWKILPTTKGIFGTVIDTAIQLEIVRQLERTKKMNETIEKLAQSSALKPPPK